MSEEFTRIANSLERIATALEHLHIEKIDHAHIDDIGGPSMVRSAAKNHKDVAVLTNPGQYGIFLDALNGNIQSISVEGLRKQFAFEAFKHTAEYDAAITAWMEDRLL